VGSGFVSSPVNSYFSEESNKSKFDQIYTKSYKHSWYRINTDRLIIEYIFNDKFNWRCWFFSLKISQTYKILFYQKKTRITFIFLCVVGVPLLEIVVQ
jgi:hypothetical protein